MTKIYLSLMLLLGVLVLPGCTPAPPVEARTLEADVVAFVDVHVVPMDTERVLQGHTVIVRDGVITEVGPSERVVVPPEAHRIDGQGFYLLPGLTDFHVHLRATDELLSYLAYGVTTIVHMSGASSGAPDLLRYRAQLAEGKMLGPRLLTTGPMLDGDPPIFGSVSVVVTTLEEARQVVADQQAAGYDFIKVYNNLPPDVLVAVAEAAETHGMAVIGHIPRRGGRDEALQRALAAGQDMIAHGEEYFFTYFYGDVNAQLDQGRLPYPDEAHIPAAVHMTKAAGAAVTPNLSFVAMTRAQLDNLEAVMKDPEARYLHPNVRAMWHQQNPTGRANLERFDRREQAKYAFLKKFTKALHEAEVPLLLGTDASAPGLFPGKSAHVELRELVDAGLTPYAALATGTRNAGAFLRRHVPTAAPYGVVAPGQRADLILVRNNPLADVAQAAAIEGVMIGGQWLTRKALDAQRAAAAEHMGEE